MAGFLASRFGLGAGSAPKTPARRQDNSPWAIFQRWSFGLICVGVSGTMLYLSTQILPRLIGNDLDASPVFAGFQTLNNAILHIHILTAIPPLFLGLLGFSAWLRRASGRAHRWIGTVYCCGIWVSAVTGFLLATANEHGALAKLGFSCLAISWFTATYLAYIKARRKEFPPHREWMIRSYAITLAVVSVRPMFMIDPPMGLTYDVWYQIVTWICWVPNLIVAELYIQSTYYSGKLKRHLTLHQPESAKSVSGPAVSGA